MTFGGTLTCTLTKTPFQDLVLNIKEAERLPGSDFKVTIQTSAPLNLHDYNGGNVSIAGGPFCTSCVQTFSGNNSSFLILNENGESKFIVPVQIFDDDDIPIGGTSTVITPLDFNKAKAVFSEAYIDVNNDEGGKLGNNDIIKFDRNIDGSSGNDAFCQHKPRFYYNNFATSRNYEKPNYWVAYVLSAWQFKTSEDRDPNTESSPGASPGTLPAGVSPGIVGSTVDCDVAEGGYSSIIFHEQFQEAGAAYFIAYSPATVAHELGHQFGLTHGNTNGIGGACSACYMPGCPGNMGLMSTTTPHIPDTFIPYQIHLIRSRVMSPGQD